jgi:copper chaperone
VDFAKRGLLRDSTIIPYPGTLAEPCDVDRDAEIRRTVMTELSSGAPLPLLTTSSSCACCTPAASPGDEVAAPSTGAGGAAEITSVFQVTGMTCGHCVASVTEELSALEGVSAVDVDLVPGGASAVSVASAAPLDAAAVEAAVEEAGYALAPSGR